MHFKCRMNTNLDEDLEIFKDPLVDSDPVLVTDGIFT